LLNASAFKSVLEINMSKLTSFRVLLLASAAAIVLIPSGCVQAQQSAADEEKSATMAEMKATLNYIQTQIAELNSVQAQIDLILAKTAPPKPSESSSAPSSQTPDLKSIASEVNRISREKDVLALKVQDYVAKHSAVGSVAFGSEAGDSAAKVAFIKSQIADLQAKIASKTAGTVMVPKLEVSSTPASPANSGQTAASSPATEPSGSTGAQSSGQTQEGNIQINTQSDAQLGVQTPAAQPQTEKNGLIQSIGDYVKSLFKF
jgi:outer membrane murein-binding lipoprotein Lpp